MKSFKEFIATESSKSLGFEKHYACYSSYVDRQRKSGDLEAQKFNLDFESLKAEYNEIRKDRLAGVSLDSANEIIETSINQITTKTVRGISDGSSSNASDKVLPVNEP
ncbi:hypothetical protein BGZ46_004494, partial [Entomortierella lignicola]